MSKSDFQKICDFNRAFNVPLHIYPQINIFNEDPKLVVYRLSLVSEEVKELEEAVEQKNFTEVIDALTDIRYVALGFFTALGLDADTLFSEKTIIGELYNTKIYGKPQYNIFENISLVKSLFKTIKLDLDNLTVATQTKDFELTKDALVWIEEHVLEFFVQLGISAHDSFTIVQDSNMSKLCKSENEAKETVAWYKENEKRYDSPTYKNDGDNWIVFNESTKKILKSIKYTPANFSSLLV